MTRVDQTYSRALQSDQSGRTFILVFLIAGFVTKILGEVVHELLGHGAPVLLFGGQIKQVYISILWPYELSYVGWSTPGAKLDQLIWIVGGGIIVTAIVSCLIQVLLLLWKQIRWQLSVPLFWLSFWCYISASGYLIVGGISPFGDVEELIRFGALTSTLAIIIGTVLFLIGFLTLSTILRRTLSTFLMKKTGWGILTFWLIIPAIVGLTLAGRGMFNLLLVSFSFIPILLSYLLEFRIRGKLL